MTLNVKTTLISPIMHMGSDDIIELVHKFLQNRGYDEKINGENMLRFTSFRYGKVKHRMYFYFDIDDVDNTVKSVEILLSSSLYRKSIQNTMRFYETLISGLVKFLNKNIYGWIRDATVVRIRPIDFMRQFKSRVGDSVMAFETRVEMADGSIYVMYPDRIECALDTLSDDDINAIFEIIRRYSRK